MADPGFAFQKILESYSFLLRTHRGIPWPLRARLEADRLALEALVTVSRSRKRTEIVDGCAGVESLVDARTKAEELGRSIRWVQLHAEDLGGRKIGGRWAFDN